VGFKSRSRPAGPRELAAELRAFGLSLPGAHEEFPWGERVLKVRGKVFVFLGKDGYQDGELGFSVKLPASGEALLALPFATPTGYGLGKSGWVSVSCSLAQPLPLELMQQWLEESYRAIAPKKLAAELDRLRSPVA
jgi:predicted DNA-binding protein (MmcQ/YjbR family)